MVLQFLCGVSKFKWISKWGAEHIVCRDPWLPLLFIILVVECEDQKNLVITQQGHLVVGSCNVDHESEITPLNYFLLGNCNISCDIILAWIMPQLQPGWIHNLDNCTYRQCLTPSLHYKLAVNVINKIKMALSTKYFNTVYAFIIA